MISSENESCLERSGEVDEVMQALSTVTAPQSLSHYPDELNMTTNILTRVNEWVLLFLKN